MKKYAVTVLTLVTAALILFLGVSSGGSAQNDTQKDQEKDLPKLVIPKRPSPEKFPCSKCHNYRPADRKKRTLVLYHTEIALKHADDRRWCYDCHEGDKLKLSSGELVDYDKPYLLCGQCHGTIFRDWKAGIHGRRTGMWNGDKLYRVCVSCHDPHQPKFKQIEPEKEPVSPAAIK
jgi:hypothetical protein